MVGKAWLQADPHLWESMVAAPLLLMSQWVRKQRQDMNWDLAVNLPHINSLLLAMPHLLKISQLLSSPQQGPAIQMCEPVGTGTLCIQTVTDGLVCPPHLSCVTL